jgi:hypothetical protein
MSILDRQKEKKKQKAKAEKKAEVVEQKKALIEKRAGEFTLEELEFLIKMIGGNNFKGNDLMFIYDLVNKLQLLYLDKKGVE